MLSRNASTGYDVVYFNPAGLMKMENGLYIAVNSQSLFQTKTIVSGYPNSSTYDGKITVPVFLLLLPFIRRIKLPTLWDSVPIVEVVVPRFRQRLTIFQKDHVYWYPQELAGLTRGLDQLAGYKADISFKGESIIGYSGQVGIDEFLSIRRTPLYSGHQYLHRLYQKYLGENTKWNIKNSLYLFMKRSSSNFDRTLLVRPAREPLVSSH